MVSKVRKSQTSAHLRLMVSGILLFACGAAIAQAPDNDFLDSFGFARMKDYSSHRVSSGSRFVLSNDDSKRIMPGQTFVMADISGAGMITHLWLTIAQNEWIPANRRPLKFLFPGQRCFIIT